MKKRLRLKKKFKFFIFFVLFIFMVSLFAVKKYNEYKYKQTNEYKLLQVGYNLDEVRLIIDKLNNDNEKYFTQHDKNDYIIEIIKEKYFLEKNIYEYIEYKKEFNKKSISDVIAIVNVGANKEWYDLNSVKETDLSKGNLILVNKFNYLKEDYEPIEITDINLSYSYSGNRVSRETNDAYINMAKDAKNDGIALMANSTFRTYKRQDEIYKDFYYSKGISYADNYAARAGYSEHQTGLAIDIFTSGKSTTLDFEESDAYKWLIENSY